MRLCRLSKVNGLMFDDLVNTTFQESSDRQEGGAESKIYFTAGDAKNAFVSRSSGSLLKHLPPAF
jgi:hypothetical protein